MVTATVYAQVSARQSRQGAELFAERISQVSPRSQAF